MCEGCGDWGLWIVIYIIIDVRFVEISMFVFFVRVCDGVEFVVKGVVGGWYVEDEIYDESYMCDWYSGRMNECFVVVIWVWSLLGYFFRVLLLLGSCFRELYGFKLCMKSFMRCLIVVFVLLNL